MYISSVSPSGTIPKCVTAHLVKSQALTKMAAGTFKRLVLRFKVRENELASKQRSLNTAKMAEIVS